jgi:hypothetical protein
MPITILIQVKGKNNTKEQGRKQRLKKQTIEYRREKGEQSKEE